MTFILPVLVGGLAGAIAGGLLAWHLLRRQRSPGVPIPEPPVIDPNVLRDIDRAAKAWADSHGQSDTAAGLAADKLRLVYELTARRRSGQ